MGKINLSGVYKVQGESDVFLIELEADVKPSELDIEKITQEDEDLPEDEWQAPCDEHYLNDDGTAVIGRAFEQKKLSGAKTRLAFFMYELNFKKPLKSQFGEIPLVKPVKMPERLKSIIEFENDD